MEKLDSKLSGIHELDMREMVEKEGGFVIESAVGVLLGTTFSYLGPLFIAAGLTAPFALGYNIYQYFKH